jgi:hypothetical protein
MLQCMSLLLARNGHYDQATARQLSGEDRPRLPFTGEAVPDPYATLAGDPFHIISGLRATLQARNSMLVHHDG